MLDAVFMDEGRYEAVALMISNYLQEHEHRREAKYVLRGLEDFNAKELYYITLVRVSKFENAFSSQSKYQFGATKLHFKFIWSKFQRRCEKLGRSKFEYITQFGPLSQSVRNNIQLSYQDDFSETFSCPVNSKMNPKDKVYFHDRYLNITGDQVDEIRNPDDGGDNHLHLSHY